MFFFIFILELVILFYLSRRLINALANVFYKLHLSHKTVVSVLAVLFLPGTIIHELSHLLVAGVMLIHVGEMNIVPEIEEGGVRLGSVQIDKSDPLRRTIVGVAPVLVGILSILGILYFLQQGNNFVWWQIILSLYLVFEIGNTMFSSKKDLEGVVGFLIALLIVGMLTLGSIYFLNQNLFQIGMSYLVNLNLEGFNGFFKQSVLFLMIPLSLDLIIILLTKLY